MVPSTEHEEDTEAQPETTDSQSQSPAAEGKGTSENGSFFLNEQLKMNAVEWARSLLWGTKDDINRSLV